MTILAELLDQILEQDPHASAEYFLLPDSTSRPSGRLSTGHPCRRKH